MDLEINKIYCGDCRNLLRKVDDESIDCIITSPPYWSLRDYGIESSVWDGDPTCEHKPNTNEKIGIKGKDNFQFIKEKELHFCQKCGAWKGCLGLEPTFDLYIKHLCSIFDIVKQKLKKRGTLWVNLGDTYNGSGGTGSREYFEKGHIQFGVKTPEGRYQPPKNDKDYPKKCLCLIPQRFAIEMVNRGWILRNVIIWHKSNCLPSSSKDRFTVDFEYIYFFVKNKKYFFDQDAVREPATTEFIYSRNSAKGGVQDKNNPRERWGFTREEEKDSSILGRNKRTVWNVNTKPNSEAHFACVDEKSDILTLEGWKNYKNISIKDKIATFNIISGKIEYFNPTKINFYNYKGEMIRLKNQWIDQLITPNHRVLLKYIHSSRKNGRWIDENWHYINAKNLKVCHGILIPNAGKYEGIYSIGKYKAEILGWILTDGSIRKNKSIRIYQSSTKNPHKVERIEWLLKKTNQNYKRKDRIREYKEKPYHMTNFNLNKTENDNSWIFEWIDINRTPKWKLLHLKKKELKHLFKGCIDGDGSRRRDGRISFIQKRRETHEWFRVLCIHLGYRTSFHKKTRIHQGITTHITIKNNSQIHPTVFEEVVKRQDYNGIVWCPELPNSNFIMRRNNKISITGNTFNPELITPMILAGSPENGIVLDPFAGIGTTCYTAYNLGRNYIGFELSPEYCKIAEKMMSQKKDIFERNKNRRVIKKEDFSQWI